jgi:hypothetical protein
MTESQPAPRLAGLLARYKAVGGVIEHVLITNPDPGIPDPELHRQAALFTLRILARRTDTYFDALLQRPEWRGHRRDEFFAIETREDRLTGRPVSTDEFVGPWFDPRTGRFTQHDEPAGYAYAFCNPPYSLRGDPGEDATLFLNIAGVLFQGFHPSLTVYAWTPECSNYFDDGQEWWGSFFWTTCIPDSQFVAGIAASTTD